ncbi:MAG TPA: PAS domain S-box protein [Blastocatellia bacterium]|nr:PAS domain S-box protein [Blastocatellia bacterium]
MTKTRILLVEDNPGDQRAFIELVVHENLPYDYRIAGSVAEAKHLLQSENFDVVITDHFLGDGTAFDIFDLEIDAPVIIVTGAGDEETAVRALKAGAYDYLVKDLYSHYLQVLPLTVEHAIIRKRAEDQARMLSQAMMSISESVFITDLEGRFLFANGAFCETYGYEDAEVKGRSCELLGDVTSEGEVLHRRKDGSEFPVLLSRSFVLDDRGRPKAVVYAARDISERKRAEQERERLIEQLQEALARIKTLRGLLPICASCKKIRDDQGYWKQIESYVREHSEAEFSHSICPECMERLYGDLGTEEATES